MQFAGPWPRACQITGLWKETLRKETSRFHQKHNDSIFFQTWIHKLPIAGKWVRNRPRNYLVLVFLAQISVSCSNSAHTRGAVREPRARVIVPCLSHGGAPFFWTIIWRPFFTQHANFVWQVAPKWTQHEICGQLLFRQRVKMKKCVWTAQACTDCICTVFRKSLLFADFWEHFWGHVGT